LTNRNLYGDEGNLQKYRIKSLYDNILVPKAGKTSLFAKLVQQYYGDVSQGLLLAFEKGYQALTVNAVDISDYENFEEYVDYLVDNKEDLPFKLIGIDTADVLWDMVQEDVIREWNIKNPNKRTNDIGGVGAKGKSDSGFGVGYQRAKQKVRTQIDKLTKAGYGLMVITHDKDKEVEQRDGQKFDQLVCSLPNSAREVFVNMADFMIFITIEKEKDGNDVITKRYMHFRSDGYVDAGSRFQNMPQKIEYDINEFITVFENAVKAELGDVDLDKKRKEEQRQKEEEAKENIKKIKEEISLEDAIAKVNKLAKEKVAIDKEKVLEIIKNHQANGNPNSIEDVEIAKKIIEELKSI